MQLRNYALPTSLTLRLVLSLVLLLTLLLALGPAAVVFAVTNNQSASLVLGQPDFTSTNAVTTIRTMRLSQGVTVDPVTGKVFVVDSGNSRVLRFATLESLSNGAAAEAVLGQPDFTSSDAAATAQGMNRPGGVAADSSGTLWVADSYNHRVLRFDGAASKPNGAAADGVLGQPNFTSTVSDTTASRMGYFTGVAVDNRGTLWVADNNNDRVLRFDHAASKPNGAAADGVLGQPDFTSNTFATTPNGMAWPSGVVVDSRGTLWVADSNNSRVLRFDGAANKINGANADGVLGQPDFTSSNAVTTISGMFAPSGVAVDTNGTLWVADSYNNRVLRFDGAANKANGADADGVLGQSDFTSKSAATTASGMNYPYGVTVDSSRRLWVADTGNNRVLMFAPSMTTVYIPLLIQ